VSFSCEIDRALAVEWVFTSEDNVFVAGPEDPEQRSEIESIGCIDQRGCGALRRIKGLDAVRERRIVACVRLAEGE
jgi:hypothetical protein